MARKDGPQRTIGSRYPLDVVAAVEADRKRLGLEMSEWMRMAVARTLEARVPRAEAQQYRRRPVEAAAS